MSLYRSRPVQVFKFRTSFIHNIFSERTANEETVNDIIDRRYPAPNRDYNEALSNITHHDFIRKGLGDVGSNPNLQPQVREMANGIYHSILTNTTSTKVFEAKDDISGSQLLKTVASYNIPEKYIGMFRNVDPYSLDANERTRMTKQARDTMALQGAEYIQYMYRLSGKYFRNDLQASEKAMYPTGMNSDLLGMYRVTLYADLAENQYKTFAEEMSKTYKSTGEEPFGSAGIESHKQVPFVYLVVLFRPTSANSKTTNIYVKFMEDLRSEYETYILPLQKQIPLTNLYPFHPNSVGSDFWTLKFIDKGFGDLSAKIAIRAYPDLFPTLDNDQLMKIWDRRSSEPSFLFEEKVMELGDKYHDVLKTKLPGYAKSGASVLKSASDRDIKYAFTQSDLVNCSLLDSKKCEYPLPWFIRDLFDASSRQSSDISVKNLVLFFVLSSQSRLRDSMKDEATAIFSRDKHKEMFPSNPTIAACAFIIVMASCLSEFREEIAWTSAKFESDRHASPWTVLVEKALDMQGPLFTFPNYTGMRELIQSWDLMLFSFIGGYISAARDTKLATLWRKIRVALLRMTFISSADEKAKFLKNANMHGFTENLADFKRGLDDIETNNIRSTELASYGAPSDRGNANEGHRDNSGTLSIHMRKLSQEERDLITRVKNLKPHAKPPIESFMELFDAVWAFVQKQYPFGSTQTSKAFDLFNGKAAEIKQLDAFLIPECYNALAPLARMIMSRTLLTDLETQQSYKAQQVKFVAILTLAAQNLRTVTNNIKFEKTNADYIAFAAAYTEDANYKTITYNDEYPVEYGVPALLGMCFVQAICNWSGTSLATIISKDADDAQKRSIVHLKRFSDYLLPSLLHVNKFGPPQDGIMQIAGFYLARLYALIGKFYAGADAVDDAIAAFYGTYDDEDKVNAYYAEWTILEDKIGQLLTKSLEASSTELVRARDYAKTNKPGLIMVPALIA